jgi:hypothetical protein
MKGFGISVMSVDVPTISVVGEDILLGDDVVATAPIMVIPIAAVQVEDHAEIYLRFTTLSGFRVGILFVSGEAYEQTYDVLAAHEGIIYHSFWDLNSGPTLSLNSQESPSEELIAWIDQFAPDYAGAIPELRV